MPRLQIYDPRERALVAAGDAVLAAGTAVSRPFRRRVRPEAPERILLLRLERIGDLLMALPGILDIRAALPEAAIDLVVGSWNRDMASAIPGMTRILTLDAPWLARGADGSGITDVLRRVRRWRRRRYDLAINFEPDVRSNLLMALAGARWTVGYSTGGGGAVLDTAIEYNPRVHTADNARRLAGIALDMPVAEGTASPRLAIPAEHAARAASLLEGTPSPRVAMHVPGGRAIKQWPPERFAAVADALVRDQGATIVLTGTASDSELLAGVKALLPTRRVIDVSSVENLLTVGAILSMCDLMITGDTGPMHLAAAVGTPIIAVFGPSDPVRYAPRGPRDHVVRVDLPCAPCNRIRLPPARCTGRTPDCLARVSADAVLAAAEAVLQECADRPSAHRAGSA